MNLTTLEFTALLTVMTMLTAAIAFCIKWAVGRIEKSLDSLSDSIVALRDDLHKLAMRVLSLEEWRKNGVGRRHDDPPVDPAPVRWHSAD